MNVVSTTLCMLLLGAMTAHGQFPPHLSPPTTEYSAKVLATIRKNAADFDSKDAEVRRRSILVLSKYKTNAEARSVLFRALSDGEARIRQAGLVSLVDGLADRRTALAILPLLTDSSVSVRRICSAALPRALMVLRMYTIRSADPIHGDGSAIPKEFLATFKKAHSDTDATVRKNLVAVWALLPGTVDYATFTDFLADSDRDVRISTLDKGRMVIAPRKYIVAIAGMVKDKDRTVRLQLAQILGSYSSMGGLKALETLAEDSDPTVRARALMGLMKAGRVSAWETLKTDVEKKRIKSSLAISAIELLPRLGGPGIKQLKEYLESKDMAFKTAALQTLTIYQAQAVSDEAVLKALKSGSSDVRNAAGRLLSRRPRLAASAVKALAESPHQDVRHLALQSVALAPRKEAESILTDLFLDESTTIRKAALRRIGTLKIKGWVELMSDALEDTEQEIREQAVMSLLGGAKYPIRASDPCMVPLKAYLKNGKDEALKTFIRTRPIMGIPPIR